MSLVEKAGISYDEDEEVLVELEASIVNTDRKLLKVTGLASTDATIVVTDKRIMAITGAKGKKKCCCFGTSSRSVRYFIPSQITEIGYKMEVSKKCCCGKNDFVIFLKTSSHDGVDIHLTNMDEAAVQSVLKVIYGVTK